MLEHVLLKPEFAKVGFRNSFAIPADSLRLWVRCLIAILAMILATSVRMAVDSIVGDLHPFVTYIFATMFTAWCCGFWPAFFSLVCGFLAAAYFFVTPRGSFAMSGVDVQVGVVLYVVVAIASILLSQLSQNSNRRLRANSELLQRKQVALELEVQQRQTAEQETVTLLRRLVNLQEEERRRFSRELHDQCGQDIVALQLSIKRVSDLVRSDKLPHITEMITEVDELLSRLSKEIHNLAFDLRPPSLDELGLRTAAESLLDLWGKRTGIRVDFECRKWNSNPISPEISLALYRVLQESLNNIAKHANASQVNVILEVQRNHSVLIVEDNGIGFDFGSDQRQLTTQSLGLQGMRERLASVDGQLEIESICGTGTTIFARIPNQGTNS